MNKNDGTQMKLAGFTTAETQSIFERGIDSKSWNIDNLNDGVKEARLQMAGFGTEVPKALAEVLAKTDVSAEQFQAWGKEVAKGGEGGSKAMAEMATWLDSLEEGTVKNDIATAAFGTKWEDQGQNMIAVFQGLVDAQDKTKSNQDQLNQLVDGMNSNPAVQLKDAFNNMMAALTPLLIGIAEIVGKLAAWAAANPGLTATIAAIGTAIGIVMGAFALLGPAIASVISLFATSGITAGAFGAVLAGIAGPVGIAIAAIAGIGLVVGGIAHALSGSSIEVTSWKDSVSESTAQALGSFMDLSENATLSLNQLAWGGQTITQEMANDLINTYDQMGNQVLAEMQSDHATQLQSMTDHFSKSTALTEQEEAEILDKIKESNSRKEEDHQKAQARIAEILNNAASEKRSITESEQQEINQIQEKMTDNAIKHLTENEREQKVIYENLKNEASKITAEQAAEVVKNSAKQRDEVVKEAQEQYDGTVAEIIKQRDEMGTISAEQADKLITEAQRQRDDTISAAKDTHTNVVAEAQAQASEHVSKVDWETGQIKSKWAVLRDDISTKMTNIKQVVEEKWTEAVTKTKAKIEEMKSTASTKFNDIKKTASDKFNEVKETIANKMSDAKKAVSDKLAEMKGLFSISSLLQAGRDLVQGLINGIVQMTDAAINAMTGVVNAVINKAKSLLGLASPSKLFAQYGRWISEGLAIGITDDANKVEQAITSLVNSATTTAQKNISDIQGLVSKSNKTNAQEIAQIEKDLGAERLKITQDAQKKINELRAKANETNTSDAKALATKIADIEKKAAADEKKIRDAAAKNKKQLTKQQLNDITKLHKDADTEIAKLRNTANDKAKKSSKDLAKSISDIEAKAGQDRIKASKKAGEQIAKVEGTLASDRMAALKADVEAKKQAGKLNAKAETDYWRYAATAFKVGSKEHTEAMKLYNTALANYNKERLDDVKNYISDKKSLDQLSLKDEVLIWQANIDAFEEGSKERLEAQKAYKTSLEALNKEITSINQTYQNEMQKINDDLIKQENDLTKAYDDAFKNRYNSLMSFAGTFDDFAVEFDVSGQQLIDSMTNQLVALNQFETLFEALSKRGVSADLLQEISEMGVKALPELMALVNMTDDQLTSYSNLYDAKAKKAREMAEAELVGMKEDTKKQIDELRKVANTELSRLEIEWRSKIKGVTQATANEFASLKQIGIDAGTGLLNGLSSMQGPLISKAQQIANAISSTIASALQISSPSKLTTRFGQWIGQGLIDGMDNMLNKVGQSSARLSDSVISAQSSLTSSAAKSHAVTSNVSNATSNIDNRKSFAPTVNVYTTESPEKVMQRELRKMAFQF